MAIATAAIQGLIMFSSLSLYDARHPMRRNGSGKRFDQVSAQGEDALR
jgi:hypothetical protein